MFTCHEHITDIFEEAAADVRVLPPRDGSEPVRRRRKPVLEIEPPPPPPAVPEPVDPPRIRIPEIDPNPLLQMAAQEEPLFDPVHPLPEKHRRERKRKLKPKLPDYWPLAEIPQPRPRRPSSSACRTNGRWPKHLPLRHDLRECPHRRPSNCSPTDANRNRGRWPRFRSPPSLALRPSPPPKSSSPPPSRRRRPPSSCPRVRAPSGIGSRGNRPRCTGKRIPTSE